MNLTKISHLFFLTSQQTVSWESEGEDGRMVLRSRPLEEFHQKDRGKLWQQCDVLLHPPTLVAVTQHNCLSVDLWPHRGPRTGLSLRQYWLLHWQLLCGGPFHRRGTFCLSLLNVMCTS